MLSGLEKQLIQILYDENVELTYLEAELINRAVAINKDLVYEKKCTKILLEKKDELIKALKEVKEEKKKYDENTQKSFDRLKYKKIL